MRYHLWNTVSSQKTASGSHKTSHAVTGTPDLSPTVPISWQFRRLLQGVISPKSLSSFHQPEALCQQASFGILFLIYAVWQLYHIFSPLSIPFLFFMRKKPLAELEKMCYDKRRVLLYLKEERNQGMATTHKKTQGGKRVASSSTQKKRTSTSSRSKGTKGKKQPAQSPIRREVGAFICLVLAIFSVFGCFHMDALFLNFFSAAIKGLIGYGFWLMPCVFLLASFILFFHRGRPVIGRLVCTFVLPILLACVIHAISGTTTPWAESWFQTTWQSGQELKSGGVLSGVLAQGFSQIFSRPGASVIFVLGLLLTGLGAFNWTVVDVADWFMSRPKYEPQEKPERPIKEHKAPKRVQKSEPEHRMPLRAEFDVPMDGEAPYQPKRQSKKKGFFDKTPGVPTPDQFLMQAMASQGKKTAPPVEETPVQVEPEQPHSSVPPVIEEPAPVMTKPEPVIEEPPIPAAVEEYPAYPSDADIVEEVIEEEPPSIPTTQEPEPVVPTTTKFPEIIREPAVSREPPRPAQTAPTPPAPKTETKFYMAGTEGQPYQYPPLTLLKAGKGDFGGEALVELNANKQRLSDTIRSFGIDANIINVTRGPSVTRYELELDAGVRLNKLTNLSDDIALSLGATGVRIAPIPNKISMVGVEVPNKVVSPVPIHTVLSSKEFQESTSKVSFSVGKDITGRCVVGNIAKLPHLLIAGTTGSGKSVCTNSLIISLLYKSSPEEVRLIMVDPKMVELGIYNGIPHLLIPVVTDPKKAAGALQWAVTEMMKRYRVFSEVGVRDLASYNQRAAQSDGTLQKMPQVVVVIDELADLMLVAAKEVEESICRVAQMGRASGIHLIIATQRPSADVITGLMKANIPSRIAFAVASAMESRIILDTQGAEKLVGRGDMLYAPLGSGKPTRVQGCFISDEEVAAVVDFIKEHSGTAQYDDAVMEEIEQHALEKEKSNNKGANVSADNDDYDELIDTAIDVVVELGQASASLLQRRLKLGYARAARLIDQMEDRGIVGPFEGSKARQVLITKEQWHEIQYRQGISLPNRTPEEPPFDIEDNDNL